MNGRTVDTSSRSKSLQLNPQQSGEKNAGTSTAFTHRKPRVLSSRLVRDTGPSQLQTYCGRAAATLGHESTAQQRFQKAQLFCRLRSGGMCFLRGHPTLELLCVGYYSRARSAAQVVGVVIRDSALSAVVVVGQLYDTALCRLRSGQDEYTIQ